jgi:hypothetical protein
VKLEQVQFEVLQLWKKDCGNCFGGDALKYPKLTMREKMIICEVAELIARLFIEGMNKIAVEDNLEFAGFSMMKHRITKAVEEL